MEEYDGNLKSTYISTDKKSADSFFFYYTKNEKNKFLIERLRKDKSEKTLEEKVL